MTRMGSGRGIWVAAVLMLSIATAIARADSGVDPSPAAAKQSGSIPEEVPIGLLTERTGGSLFRATLPNGESNPLASSEAVNYLAIPAPTPKLLKKHDLVTIVVNEQSTSTTTGDNNLQKTADFDAAIPTFVQFVPQDMQLIEQTPTTPLELKMTGQRDLKGTAEVDRSDIVTARITAMVLDVKPNGTMVLQASEKIKTDDEEQSMVLTGTCRVEDVTADNTVLSTQLFDLNLTKTTKGQVRDTNKRGLFPRFLDWLNPF
jgi:flagellar L-ring protein FlgH